MESWKGGKLESWKVGKLEGWKVGMFESWNVGKLVSWNVGRLGSWKVGKLECYVQKNGKLEIGKVRSPKLESVCRFSSCLRQSVFCRDLPVKKGKCRRMAGGSICIYMYTRRYTTALVLMVMLLGLQAILLMEFEARTLNI